MNGISIKPTIGIGDALQFSSLPENYFKYTGEKLVDVSRPWFFDFNPYVERTDKVPETIVEMWNFGPRQYEFPKLRPPDKPQVYLSNAEIWAGVWGVKCRLNRPRLYRFEDYPFEKRELILLHCDGISHGFMPQHIVDHIVEKYQGTGSLYFLGKKDPRYSDKLGSITTPTLWDLAGIVSEARMFIGVDSGPSWVAACYPDVVVKKVRTKPLADIFENWIPLEMQNVHSHWDSREHTVYNPTIHDIGFTSSYLKI